jgi:hypothetical protein
MANETVFPHKNYIHIYYTTIITNYFSLWERLETKQGREKSRQNKYKEDKKVVSFLGLGWCKLGVTWASPLLND